MTCHCKRCGKSWDSLVEKPKKCRHCASPFWDKDRVRDVGKFFHINEGCGADVLTAKHFNGLSPAEDERLALLLEECGEVLQCVGKIQRHGYESSNPLDSVTNRQDLERELGDLMAAVYLLRRNFDVRPIEIEKARVRKMENLAKWMHHNKIGAEDIEGGGLR